MLIGSLLAWLVPLNLPVITSVADYQPPQATLILDRNGEALDAIAREFRLLVPYEQLPELLPKAFVAAEDGHFWKHSGVDGWSILRAAVNNLLSRSRKQGGSTITQQVTRALVEGMAGMKAGRAKQKAPMLINGPARAEMYFFLRICDFSDVVVAQ